MRKKKLTFILIISFTLFISNNTDAQLSSKQVDSLVQKSMKQFDVAGVAIAIVKDGKIIHEKG